jgi:sterol desaturase/sphingolipid hydroxylase (fatty acid hydroxylase superfamily)
MSDVLARLWIVLVISGSFWGIGVWVQRSHNTIRSSDYSIASKSQWVRLLGLRPQVDRVYLREAFTQIVGLIYLLVGSFVALSGNTADFWHTTRWLFLIWFGGAIVFGLLDISQYVRKK